MPTSEIRAEWAAQRIKGLSFFERARRRRSSATEGNKVKSLISEFHYPRYGPGQMWEAMTDDIEQLGGEVLLETAGGARSFIERRPRRGDRRRAARRFEPAARDLVAAAARTTVEHGRARRRRPRCATPPRGLRYRDFLTVALVLDGEDLFPDNWIYIHEPGRAASAASRTTAPGAPGWFPTRPRPAWASSTSASTATSCGTMDDDDLVAARARASSEQLGLADARRSSAASWCGCPRPTRCTTPTTPSAWTRSASWLDGIDNLQPGRPQRAAPLQQLGPLDAHRHARGGERS